MQRKVHCFEGLYRDTAIEGVHEVYIDEAIAEDIGLSLSLGLVAWLRDAEERPFKNKSLATLQISDKYNEEKVFFVMRA